MIALLQRVTHACVKVDGRIIGRIDCGLLVLVCAERGDNKAAANRLLDRLLACRIFSDKAGKMNLNVADIDGGLLLVPQFTLAADTRKGTRPSFTRAAPSEEGQKLFEHLVGRARGLHPKTETGQFGANMQVNLTNDGPVTIWLQVQP